jgi:hypothetical protein
MWCFGSATSSVNCFSEDGRVHKCSLCHDACMFRVLRTEPARPRCLKHGTESPILASGSSSTSRQALRDPERRVRGRVHTRRGRRRPSTVPVARAQDSVHAVPLAALLRRMAPRAAFEISGALLDTDLAGVLPRSANFIFFASWTSGTFPVRAHPVAFHTLPLWRTTRGSGKTLVYTRAIAMRLTARARGMLRKPRLHRGAPPLSLGRNSMEARANAQDASAQHVSSVLPRLAGDQCP